MQAPPLWLGGLSPFPSALGEPICHPKQRWLSQSVQEGGIQSGRASSNVLATHVAAGWGGGCGADLRRFISRTVAWSPDSRLPPGPACFSLCEAGPGFRHIKDRLFFLLPPQLLLRILQKLTLNLGMGSAFGQAGLESQRCPSTSPVNWGSYTATPSQGSSLLIGDNINCTRLFFNLMRIMQVSGWQLAGQRVTLHL